MIRISTSYTLLRVRLFRIVLVVHAESGQISDWIHRARPILSMGESSETQEQQGTNQGRDKTNRSSPFMIRYPPNARVHQYKCSVG